MRARSINASGCSQRKVALAALSVDGSTLQASDKLPISSYCCQSEMIAMHPGRALFFASHAQVLSRLFLYLFVRDENSTAALRAAGRLGDLAKARIT